jgi:hypothetical protein
MNVAVQIISECTRQPLASVGYARADNLMRQKRLRSACWVRVTPPEMYLQMTRGLGEKIAADSTLSVRTNVYVARGMIKATCSENDLRSGGASPKIDSHAFIVPAAVLTVQARLGRDSLRLLNQVMLLECGAG